MFLGKTLFFHCASLHPGAKMGTSENAGGNPVMDWHPIQGEVEILLSCYRNWDRFVSRPLPFTIDQSEMQYSVEY